MIDIIISEPEDITMTAEFKIATMIEFIEALTDTSSDEYRVAADNIRAIFQEEIENVAGLYDGTLSALLVEFQRGSGGQRKRRSTGATAVAAIKAVFSVAVLKSTDLTELQNDLSSSVQTGADAAISNSDGTSISTDAVVAVCDGENCQGMFMKNANYCSFSHIEDVKCPFVKLVFLINNYLF